MGIWDIYVTQIRGIPVAKPHARWYSAATPLRASQRATAATAVGAIPGPRMEADHGEAKAKARELNGTSIETKTTMEKNIM